MSKKLTINTERLVLRPLDPSDLKTTHEYASDAGHAKYMVHLPNSTEQETENFLLRVAAEWEKETPSFYEFAITLDGNHIGAVSLYLDNGGQECELGWIVNKKHTGMGYVTEAAKAAFDLAVDKFHAKKILACCDARNSASIRVMEKIGLSLERDDLTRRNKGDHEDARELLYSKTIC